VKFGISRALTRFGLIGAGVLVAGMFAAPASAAAAGSDLAVSLSGTTIAAFGIGKFGKVTVTNNGPETPTGVTLTYDLSALDTSKVTATVGGCDETSTDVFECEVPDDGIPASGGNLDLVLPLDHVLGEVGPAGSITVTVAADIADPDSSNNSKTVDVFVGNDGVDIQVLAADVYALDNHGSMTSDPVPPGASSEVDTVFFNWGDEAALGLRVVVTLPEFVTFAEVDPACTYSSDNRVATREFGGLTLDFWGDSDAIAWPVTVSGDAPGPVGLTGGLVTGAALAIDEPPPPDLRSALPKHLRRVQIDQVSDVDPSDGQDGFTVFVAAPEEPDLPVTGARASLYAASGLGLLLLGVLIVLLARRRRHTPPPASECVPARAARAARVFLSDQPLGDR
jgi:LPXTG-motif cell wall-anchored protein